MHFVISRSFVKLVVYRKAFLNFKRLYLGKQQSDSKVSKGNFKNIFSTFDFFFARELFLHGTVLNCNKLNIFHIENVILHLNIFLFSLSYLCRCKYLSNFMSPPPEKSKGKKFFFSKDIKILMEIGV